MIQRGKKPTRRFDNILWLIGSVNLIQLSFFSLQGEIWMLHPKLHVVLHPFCPRQTRRVLNMRYSTKIGVSWTSKENKTETLPTTKM